MTLSGLIGMQKSEPKAGGPYPSFKKRIPATPDLLMMTDAPGNQLNPGPGREHAYLQDPWEDVAVPRQSRCWEQLFPAERGLQRSILLESVTSRGPGQLDTRQWLCEICREKSRF